MERKPQQQTLSIRISDSLRDFLEACKDVIRNARGESVSISDVAKTLLELARDDRLDFRLEVGALQQAPTESLLGIRRKWEQRRPLARAEWIFLAKYIQVACEELSENPTLPDNSTLASVLEAFLAVRGLRTEGGAGLDRYYLSNLGAPDETSFNERQFDPQLVPKVVVRLMEELRESSSRQKATFAGRCLFVALRDEMLTDLIALNQVLEPLLTRLFRLAARGHWIRERRPIQTHGEVSVYKPLVPPVVSEGISLTIFSSTESGIQMALVMDPRGISYPVGQYPELREFAALLEQLEPGGIWNGLHFHASSDLPSPSQSARFRFRRQTDALELTFAEKEWQDLRYLITVLLKEPLLQSAYEELSLIYGEL